MASNVIPSDSQSIYAALSQLQQQALVLPNNTPPGGIAGFIFGIATEDMSELSSDITDHYLEDNTAIQDQIALRPERITLRGMVAELTQQNLGIPDAPTFYPMALPICAPLLPGLTPGTTQTFAEDNANQEQNNLAIAGTAQNLYQYYQNQAGRGPSLSAQSLAYGYFYQLWQGRMIFTIETPWGIYESMAIEEVRTVQPETTRTQSEFQVRFKKIRIAGDLVPVSGQLSGRAQNQFEESSPTNQGLTGLTPLSTTQTANFFQSVSSASFAP